MLCGDMRLCYLLLNAANPPRDRYSRVGVLGGILTMVGFRRGARGAQGGGGFVRRYEGRGITSCHGDPPAVA
jgi:hypothetical protein